MGETYDASRRGVPIPTYEDVYEDEYTLLSRLTDLDADTFHNETQKMLMILMDVGWVYVRLRVVYPGRYGDPLTLSDVGCTSQMLMFRPWNMMPPDSRTVKREEQDPIATGERVEEARADDDSIECASDCAEGDGIWSMALMHQGETFIPRMLIGTSFDLDTFKIPGTPQSAREILTRHCSVELHWFVRGDDMPFHVMNLQYSSLDTSPNFVGNISFATCYGFRFDAGPIVQRLALSVSGHRKSTAGDSQNDMCFVHKRLWANFSFRDIITELDHGLQATGDDSDQYYMERNELDQTYDIFNGEDAHMIEIGSTRNYFESIEEKAPDDSSDDLTGLIGREAIDQLKNLFEAALARVSNSSADPRRQALSRARMRIDSDESDEDDSDGDLQVTVESDHMTTDDEQENEGRNRGGYREYEDEEYEESDSEVDYEQAWNNANIPLGPFEPSGSAFTRITRRVERIRVCILARLNDAELLTGMLARFEGDRQRRCNTPFEWKEREISTENSRRAALMSQDQVRLLSLLIHANRVRSSAASLRDTLRNRTISLYSPFSFAQATWVSLLTHNSNDMPKMAIYARLHPSRMYYKLNPMHGYLAHGSEGLREWMTDRIGDAMYFPFFEGQFTVYDLRQNGIDEELMTYKLEYVLRPEESNIANMRSRFEFEFSLGHAVVQICTGEAMLKSRRKYEIPMGDRACAWATFDDRWTGGCDVKTYLRLGHVTPDIYNAFGNVMESLSIIDPYSSMNTSPGNASAASKNAGAVNTTAASRSKASAFRSIMWTALREYYAEATDPLVSVLQEQGLPVSLIFTKSIMYTSTYVTLEHLVRILPGPSDVGTVELDMENLGQATRNTEFSVQAFGSRYTVRDKHLYPAIATRVLRNRSSPGFVVRAHSWQDDVSLRIVAEQPEFILHPIIARPEWVLTFLYYPFVHASTLGHPITVSGFDLCFVQSKELIQRTYERWMDEFIDPEVQRVADGIEWNDGVSRRSTDGFRPIKVTLELPDSYSGFMILTAPSEEVANGINPRTSLDVAVYVDITIKRMILPYRPTPTMHASALNNAQLSMLFNATHASGTNGKPVLTDNTHVPVD